MGCASGKNLQVVNNNNLPTERNNRPPSTTATDVQLTPVSQQRRRSIKVRKISGTIDTFTVLWSELPPQPELSLLEVSELKPTNPMECWDCVRATSVTGDSEVKPATKRRGWKTIRLFVSSTFKDFHAEREVLVKQVNFSLTINQSVHEP